MFYTIEEQITKAYLSLVFHHNSFEFENHNVGMILISPKKNLIPIW